MDERMENKVITSTEEINELLERLKFSEEKSVQVVSTSEDKRTQGFESWAVGKIMAREQPNREAMYRVFKSLWYTKEEVDFVSLKEGVIIVKFGCLEDRSRILNLMPLPIEVMDRQTALNIRNAIGELMAIDWKDHEQEARDIIKRIWDDKNSDMSSKMDMVRKELGPWQYKRYKRMKIEINRLEKKIGKIMDGPISVGSLHLLKKSQDQLGQSYDAEEKYWAQRARNQWPREGDRNTWYFHVRATGRKKKKSIDKLKDMHGTWYEDKKDICHIVWSYFHNLFKTSTDPNEDAAKLLSEGFGWTVGNGKNIRIWQDNWGFEGLSGESICINKSLVKERFVRDLLNASHDGWDKERVSAIFGDFLGDQICNIPILHDALKDRRTWFHNPHGVFSSKSAYSWLILKQIGFGPHRIFWRIIWRLKTLPKIRIFCWRLGHNILPTYEKISSFRSDFNDTCPRCGKDKETLIHALKDCSMARKVLEFGGLDNKLLDGNYLRCVDWIDGAARILDIKALSDFITVLWNVWNSRNNKIKAHVKNSSCVATSESLEPPNRLWLRITCTVKRRG
ncbi:hypothetical protein Gotri_027388 [Gossypium trilobum]|uniref:Reverse transcriptase zinc-binding domain-containing protein n=1 Tax=Gossypium trilobum TaxID=34281 RepID=A0A7J9FQ15_9ROSI|nr:hypothetical protein [Gossypium trilobum]